MGMANAMSMSMSMSVAICDGNRCKVEETGHAACLQEELKEISRFLHEDLEGLESSEGRVMVLMVVMVF